MTFWENKAILQAIKADAVARYPEEACGLIINDEYVPKRNTHESPKDFFRIDRDDYPTNGSLQAVVHSHPDAKKGVEPSIEDMHGQLAAGIPWGLVSVWKDAISEVMFWGDGLPVPDLIGRQFRSGPSGTDGRGDCYAMLRDFYRTEMGFIIKEYPRDDTWWATHDREQQGDMYRENFADAGFKQIDESELQYGDCLLMAIRANKPNHAAIYLGNGLMLHHLAHRLSRREPANPYKRMITHYLRYDGAMPLP